MAGKRLAVVTGGARNIGRAIVLKLARQGRLPVAIDIDKEQLSELEQLAQKEGYEVLTEQLDITDSAALSGTIGRLADEHGGIGILVNNAGITRDGLMMRMTDEDFDRVIAINLKAAFVATRAVTPSMVRNRFGRIVNIASVAGVAGNAGQVNYAASKAGLIGMAKTVAKEFAKKNITANSVAPGFIATSMTEVLPDKVKELAKMAIPMRRFGTTEDVAHLVAFLCSDEAGYITGQVVCVDGGMVM